MFGDMSVIYEVVLGVPPPLVPPLLPLVPPPLRVHPVPLVRTHVGVPDSLHITLSSMAP